MALKYFDGNGNTTNTNQQWRIDLLDKSVKIYQKNKNKFETNHIQSLIYLNLGMVPPLK